jgi:predicted HTH domain antitoxin
MAHLNLEMPVEVLSALRKELRLAAAIHWYQRGIVSQEKAASVAGLDRSDFLMALTREGVDAFTVDFDDLQRELDLG